MSAHVRQGNMLLRHIIRISWTKAELQFPPRDQTQLCLQNLMAAVGIEPATSQELWMAESVWFKKTNATFIWGGKGSSPPQLGPVLAHQIGDKFWRGRINTRHRQIVKLFSNRTRWRLGSVHEKQKRCWQRSYRFYPNRQPSPLRQKAVGRVRLAASESQLKTQSKLLRCTKSWGRRKY